MLFRRYFQQHIFLSIQFASTLSEVLSKTDKLLDPSPGANIPSRYCPGNGSGHMLWPTYKRAIITNVTLKHMYSQGLSHYPLQHESASKTSDHPKNTLTNLTETSTRRKADSRTINYHPGSRSHRTIQY